MVVFYDRLGIFSAPRVWYTFKIFGKTNIAVLDGGLPKWIAEGHPVETGEYELYQNETTEKNEKYSYKLDNSKIKNLEYIKNLSKTLFNQKTQLNEQILDARSSGRFNGTHPEPRKGLKSGSIPGSVNSFFQNILNPDKTFKSPSEIREILLSAGVNFDEGTNIINSCGSGMTACINILGLEIAGKTNHSLYDGSWTEWASKTDI